MNPANEVSQGIRYIVAEEMSDEIITKREIALHLLRIGIGCAISYMTIKIMMKYLDPTRQQKQEAARKAKEIMKRLGINRDVKFSEHELAIASQLVEPSTIQTSWNDIAGLSSIIEELQETLIIPIAQRERFKGSTLIKPPKGVLLHGPPGCGKTMLARATAREAGTRFINLQVSMLTDKWYGESEKLAAAVFTLAKKVQPCIIFIDEIDCFLRSRDGKDHEATAMMKAQFLSLWDGLANDEENMVVIVGATNRPQDIDRAILRRMPAAFQIGYPNTHQRESILKLILGQEPISKDVNLTELAEKTPGYSGSDLRELCRTAAMLSVRAQFRVEASSGETFGPITRASFEQAIAKINTSKVPSSSYPLQIPLS